MNSVFRFSINQVHIDLKRRVYHADDAIPSYPSYRAIGAAFRDGRPLSLEPKWTVRAVRIDASDWPVSNIFMPLRQLTWRVLRRRSAKALHHFPNVVLRGPR